MCVVITSNWRPSMPRIARDASSRWNWGYVIQGGPLKNVGLLARKSIYRNNFPGTAAFRDENQTRFLVTYSDADLVSSQVPGLLLWEQGLPAIEALRFFRNREVPSSRASFAPT